LHPGIRFERADKGPNSVAAGGALMRERFIGTARGRNITLHEKSRAVTPAYLRGIAAMRKMLVDGEGLEKTGVIELVRHGHATRGGPIMAHIKIVLDQIECLCTSFGLGDDDVYVLTFAVDPTVTPAKLLGSSIAGIWQMGKGSTVKDQTLIELTPNPAPDGLEWIILVYDKFLFGLDQAQLDKAIQVAQQTLNLAQQAQVQFGQSGAGNVATILVDAIIDAILKIFIRWGRDPKLGQDQQRLSPPKPDKYTYSFVCTGDSSDYNVHYTVTLS
jgi:hypothetical protein